MKIPLYLLFGVMVGLVRPSEGQPANNINSAVEAVRKPELTISNQDAQPVTAIAYSSNGQFLAVANRDHVIRLYGTQNGQLTSEGRELARQSQPVLAMRFHEINVLVSVAEDGTVKSRDILSGKLLQTTKLDLGLRAVAAIAPGRQPLIASGAPRTVQLWDYERGKRLHDFEVNDSFVAALAFTPDAKALVVGSTKGVVRVIDVASWTVTWTIDLDSPVYALAASTNHILVGYSDGTLTLLTPGNAGSVPEVKKHDGAITAIAFSPKGDHFASASTDQTVKLWDTETLKLLCSFGGHRAAVLAVAFSPDGRRLVSGDTKGIVKCWAVPH